MSTYEPGSVAAIRQFNAETERRALRVGNIGWHLRPCTDAEEQAGLDFVRDELVADVRPLVVLDLKEANPYGIPEIVLGNLIEVLEQADFLGCEGVAKQIKAQTKPPRIAEPGLWGVVEARTASGVRMKWTNDGASWVPVGGMRRTEWSELIDPVLIREGVES